MSDTDRIREALDVGSRLAHTIMDGERLLEGRAALDRVVERLEAAEAALEAGRRFRRSVPVTPLTDAAQSDMDYYAREFDGALTVYGRSQETGQP